jgi:hypothetical protein
MTRTIIATFAMMLLLGAFAAGQVTTGNSGSVTSIAPPTLTFQALSDTEVFVLGTNGGLWLEQAPWGTIPPSRVQIDGNVQNFQALSDTEVLVLGTDGKLWLEQAPWGTVPPNRTQVDGTVKTFQARLPCWAQLARK